MKNIANWALNLAQLRGATYADARVISQRSRALTTKNGKVGSASDAESVGMNVRVIADGAWAVSYTHLKGLAAASIGCLLESRGLKVNLMKFDPYLNVDPGTMSPFQHGEVFVTDDGAETDLDLGHYERFTHAKLSRDNNLSLIHI